MESPQSGQTTPTEIVNGVESALRSWVCILLIAGAVQSCDGQGPIPDSHLHTAVLNGDLQRAEALIANDPTLVHAIDRDGDLPLHVAAKHCRPEFAELLIKNGAEVDALSVPQGSDFSSTALFDAADENCGEVARVLLDHGADAGFHPTFGWSVLVMASHSAIGDPVVARMILEEHGYHGEHEALEGAIARNNETLLALLLESGAVRDINNKCYMCGRRTPLLEAVHREASVEIAKVLVEHGADPLAKDYQDRTALQLAEGNEPMTAYLESLE